MTFTIKNGVLTTGSKRILLAHVIAYDATQSTLVIYFSNHRESLNIGADVVKCAAALDEHFGHSGKLDEAEFDRKFIEAIKRVRAKEREQNPPVYVPMDGSQGMPDIRSKQ